jgi:hypothetical protein
MEATHTVQYEGLKFEVIGDYRSTRGRNRI